MVASLKGDMEPIENMYHNLFDFEGRDLEKKNFISFLKTTTLLNYLNFSSTHIQRIFVDIGTKNHTFSSRSLLYAKISDQI